MHTRGTTSFDRPAPFPVGNSTRKEAPITLRSAPIVAADAPIGITGDAPG